jgi:TonB family protein
MSVFESWLLGYLLNSLWQVPLIFAVAWLVARLVNRVDPRMEHRVWVSALLLQAVLPACRVHPLELGRAVWDLMSRGWGGRAADGHVRIAIGPATTHGGLWRLPTEVLVVTSVVYGCAILYFAGRLGWGVWKTSVMRRQAERVTLNGGAAQSWDRYSRFFGVGTGSNTASLAVSSKIPGPVTVGIRRGVLLVPPGFLESVSESDQDALLAHEFAHMRRHDFAKNLVYELISLPVTHHPLFWLTRSRVAESREMVCDAMAAQAVAGREEYARSLLRLASMLVTRAPARTFHAIGIFDANAFERRVMNLTKSYGEIHAVRRFAVAAACVVVGVATCASALALRMETPAPMQASTEQQAASPGRLKVKASILAGQLLTHKNPAYPAQARADGISGAVILSVTINKDGEPINVAVKTGVRDDLDEAAVTAVQQWRWKPYLLNGEPVEVDSTVTINYSIGN